MNSFRKTIIILSLITLTLSLCCCNTDLSNLTKKIVNIDYELKEGEELEPFYASENQIYAAVNKRKSPSMSIQGFTVTTEKFIVYNQKSKKVEAEYKPEEKEIYIYHAVPFEKGILYTVYTPPISPEESVRWDIKYISEKGVSILDTGYCSSMLNMLPDFTIIDGKVYYLHEGFDGHVGTGFGIKRADLSGPETVVREKEGSLIETEFYSNGTDYVINIDEKFLIGNKEGIYRKYILPKPMSDYGICRNYLFCCTETEGNRWTTRSISLETGEEYTAEIDKPLYRIASMQGDELTCIDENFDMYVLRPGKKFEMVSLENQEEIREGRRNVKYYPYDETKTLAQLDNTKFCRIIW